MNVETMRVSGRTEATSSSLRIPDCPQVSRSSSAWDQKFSSCSASVLSGAPVKLLSKSTVLVKTLPDIYVYIHLYTCVCVCVQSLSHIQLFAILWTVALLVHGILQPRILEWVAIFFSRGSSQPQELNLNLLWADSLHHLGSPNTYVCVCVCLCVCTCVSCCAKLLQLCPILCDPMGCRLPGSSVHGIL